MTKSENYIAKLIKLIAVIKVVIVVKRAELMGLRQDHDLSEHLPLVFEAKLKLEISKQSASANVTSLQERINKGCDRRVVFRKKDILPNSSYEIISLIESKEMGRHVTEN